MSRKVETRMISPVLFKSRSPSVCPMSIDCFFFASYKLPRWIYTRCTCWASCKYSASLQLDACLWSVSHSPSWPYCPRPLPTSPFQPTINRHQQHGPCHPHQETDIQKEYWSRFQRGENGNYTLGNLDFLELVLYLDGIQYFSESLFYLFDQKKWT